MQRIITKDQRADAAFLIIKGEVEVYLEKHGRVVSLGKLSRGAIFGESALFGTNTYSANVRAIKETEVTLLTAADFKKRIAGTDPILKAIFLMLIERLRKSNEALLKLETQEFMDIEMI